jgi:N,N-dimethylformamidase
LASSPLGERIQGYLDRRHCDAGEALDLMASGPEGRVAVTVERLGGEPAGWDVPASVDVKPRRVPYGSFARIGDAPHLRPADGFTLALWCRPTRLSGGWHTIAAKWSADDPGFGLFVGGAGVLTAGVRAGDGRVAWCTAKNPLLLATWQHLALCWNPEAGRIELHVTRGGSTESTARETPPGGRASAGPLLLGALAGDAGEPGDTAFHFDGRLARPALLGAALDAAGVADLAAGRPPGDEVPVLGRWAFERRVESDVVEDVSPHRHHGRAVNAPTRAVTGPAWSGRASRRYVDAPHDYDAIHLHSDDLDDAGWPAATRVEVPDDASGIYAVRLRSDADELAIPFVVRGRARAELTVLVPTLTWRAYASNRRSYTHADDGTLDGGLGLYDLHADGSPASLTTLRRPTRTLQPFTGTATWGAHLVTAALYLADWLEAAGFRYSVLSDEQLHTEGAAALSGCRCLVLPGHPEYWTSAMLDALEAFLVASGRVTYLGGNGLYWVTTMDPARPYLIEVRKSGEGDYDDDARPSPGETQHQTSAEVGGLWARRGRPASRLVGVDLAAHCHKRATGERGFRRVEASYAPDYAWVFDGVEADLVGTAGLNLGSAAGYEMDAVPEHVPEGVLERTIRLATATDPAFYGTRHVPVEPACDIALSTVAGGGAVFAAGSVTWTGSLSVDAAVGRITSNVLERFLATPPGDSPIF